MSKSLGFVLTLASALTLAGCADGRETALETCKAEIEKEAFSYWRESGPKAEGLWGPFEQPIVDVLIGQFNGTGGRISGYYTVVLEDVEIDSYVQVSGSYSCNSDVSDWKLEEYSADRVLR